MRDRRGDGLPLYTYDEAMPGMPPLAMICVTIEIREGALTHRVQIIAPSIERALKVARGGKPARRVHLVFPIDPEAFFIPEDSVWREVS